MLEQMNGRSWYCGLWSNHSEVDGVLVLWAFPAEPFLRTVSVWIEAGFTCTSSYGVWTTGKVLEGEDDGQRRMIYAFAYAYVILVRACHCLLSPFLGFAVKLVMLQGPVQIIFW